MSFVEAAQSDRPSSSSWDFLTAHALALLEVGRTPDVTIRVLADRLGLTERHTTRILGDLAAAGYIIRKRIGRRNTYELDPSRPLRHPSFADRPVADLVAALVP
jgi:DNA-binding MarR family transcriptional regulator